MVIFNHFSMILKRKLKNADLSSKMPQFFHFRKNKNFPEEISTITFTRLLNPNFTKLEESNTPILRKKLISSS